MKASKAVSLVFLITMSLWLVDTQPVMSQSSGTIYIRSDGTVEGTDKIQRDGNVYTFTNNIYDSIVVERDNIVVDGAGYTLQGPFRGIYLESRNNVTIKNVEIKTELDRYGYAFCITLKGCSNITISGNNITAPYNPQSEVCSVRCIFLEFSSNNIISGNTMTSTNNDYGLSLNDSPNNTITNNKFISCGLSVGNSYQNNVANNTVNDKPIVYLEGASDYVIDDAAQVTLVNCNNMEVKNLVLPIVGIQLLGTNNTEIANNEADIYLENSSRNDISGNKGSIKLVYSENNNISGNSWGISLSSSSNNVVSGNEGSILTSYCSNVSIVGNNLGGIELHNSGDFLVSGNNIEGNGKGEGILLSFSSYSTICNNIITKHNYGFYLYVAGGNTIYGNNIVDNNDQVCSWYSSNVWDNGSKGNYWSDYAGNDTDHDGIGDSPYIIAIQGSVPAANDQDRYPLMNPVVIPEFPDTTPPAISVVSPENKTYAITDVPLNFTVTESVSWIAYSLDGQTNVTITGDIILTGLSDGPHSLIVYANDTFGYTGASETIYFSVSQPEPFPTWIAATTVIVLIAAVAAALLVYLVKGKKTTGKAEIISEGVM